MLKIWDQWLICMVWFYSNYRISPPTAYICVCLAARPVKVVFLDTWSLWLAATYQTSSTIAFSLFIPVSLQWVRDDSKITSTLLWLFCNLPTPPLCSNIYLIIYIITRTVPDSRALSPFKSWRHFWTTPKVTKWN